MKPLRNTKKKKKKKRNVVLLMVMVLLFFSLALLVVVLSAQVLVPLLKRWCFLVERYTFVRLSSHSLLLFLLLFRTIRNDHPFHAREWVQRFFAFTCDIQVRVFLLELHRRWHFRWRRPFGLFSFQLNLFPVTVSIRRRHLLKTDRQTEERITRRLVCSRDLSYALFTERIYIQRERERESTCVMN